MNMWLVQLLGTFKELKIFLKIILFSIFSIAQNRISVLIDDEINITF